MRAPWLKTDEFEEAVSSLEAAAEFASHVVDDPYRWKWVLIALHNSLQGFMVIALRHGNGLLALRDDVAAKWLTAYREGKRFPKEKLDSFSNLYGKIKSDAMLAYINSKKFSPGTNDDHSMKKLKDLRNEFIHFVPKGWLLELAGLPTICIECLSVLHFLGWKCGNIVWYKKGLRKRAESALKEFQANLETARRAYQEDNG